MHKIFTQLFKICIIKLKLGGEVRVFWIYLKKSLGFNFFVLFVANWSLIAFFIRKNYFFLIIALLIYMFIFKGYSDFKHESFDSDLFDEIIENVFNIKHKENEEIEEDKEKNNKRNKRR